MKRAVKVELGRHTIFSGNPGTLLMAISNSNAAVASVASRRYSMCSITVRAYPVLWILQHVEMLRYISLVKNKLCLTDFGEYSEPYQQSRSKACLAAAQQSFIDFTEYAEHVCAIKYVRAPLFVNRLCVELLKVV